MRSYILLLVYCLAVACSPDRSGDANDTNNADGLRKYYYPEGQLYLESTYKDNVPHGKSTQYFKNGKVFEEVDYVKGKMNGILKRYHEDGKLSLQCPYDSGKRHGVEIKYRKDGTIAYEAPYHQDEPTVGLKEYYLNGQLIEKYPQIVIREEDRLFRNFIYALRFSLSEKRKAEFFEGSLTDGLYIGRSATAIMKEDAYNGRIEYEIAPGQFLMKKLNIITRFKTDLGNTYIGQKQHHLAIENR